MRLFQNDSTIGAYSLKKSHYSATSGISVVLNDHPKYMLCWYYVSNITIGTNTRVYLTKNFIFVKVQTKQLGYFPAKFFEFDVFVM